LSGRASSRIAISLAALPVKLPNENEEEGLLYLGKNSVVRGMRHDSARMTSLSGLGTTPDGM
jgi:hypothetical protein